MPLVNESGSNMNGRMPAKQRSDKARLKRRIAYVAASAIVLLFVLSGLWLAGKANTIENELEAAVMLVPELQTQVLAHDDHAGIIADRLALHTGEAHRAATDPMWMAASSLPWIGPTFQATTEISVAADDIAKLGAKPLVFAAKGFDLSEIAPRDGVVNLEYLSRVQPALASGSHAIAQSAERLNSIKSAELLPQVAASLDSVREKINTLRAELDGIADAASIVPEMLGSAEKRSYLVIMQNNSESRASGGIPGALALMHAEGGRLTLEDQISASAMGPLSPVLSVEAEQKQIYTSRMGKFIQDVNLTPDFPTAADLAKAMWEKKTGKSIDGVISIDPIALSYLLGATGPVQLEGPSLLADTGSLLPAQLSQDNVVRTLLSDVYAQIEQPELQDAYFASVAARIFTAMSTGQGDAEKLLEAFARSAQERRIQVWSNASDEQSLIAKYAISGSISGPSVEAAQFGVYFNDGTGAKMDYYVQRRVQLVKQCARDGYEQTSVRIISTNNAPADAAQSLPPYVTGAGVFGVPPGSVQTNIVAYGPVQATVETVTMDGQRTEFAPYLHAGRPVGVFTVRLAPGETKTVEFAFGKIVQHTEPNIVVTPSVQIVKDVTLDTINAPCA